MNTIDIIIIIIILIGLLSGFARGLLLSCLTFVSYIAAFICAKLYSLKLAEYLSKNTTIVDKINSFVTKRLNSLSLPALSIPTADVMIPKEIDSSLLQTPEYTDIMKHFPFLENIIKENIIKPGQTLTDLFVHLLFVGVCGILIFIAVKILFSVIGAILKGIVKKSSVLNSTDRFLGIIFGVMTSIIFIFVLIIILTPIIFSFPNSSIANLFTESKILHYIYSSGVYTSVLKSLINLVN